MCVGSSAGGSGAASRSAAGDQGPAGAGACAAEGVSEREAEGGAHRHGHRGVPQQDQTLGERGTILTLFSQGLCWCIICNV